MWLHSSFEYAGSYDVLESLGHSEIALDYDSAGNIVHLEMPGPDGATRITQHTIGSENELLRVTPLRAETFEQTFASNCAFCVGGVSEFNIRRVGLGPVTTGQTITFVADGSSEVCHNVNYGDLSNPFKTKSLQTRSGSNLVPCNFLHRVDFVGGSGVATYATSSAFKLFSGSFSTPGAKTVRDTLSCSCGSIFLAQAVEEVEVACPIPTDFQQSGTAENPDGILNFWYSLRSSSWGRSQSHDQLRIPSARGPIQFQSQQEDTHLRLFRKR